jgi:hypothetical protein
VQPALLQGWWGNRSRHGFFEFSMIVQIAQALARVVRFR